MDRQIHNQRWTDRYIVRDGQTGAYTQMDRQIHNKRWTDRCIYTDGQTDT